MTTEAEVYDASDPAHVNSRKAKDKRRQTAVDAALATLLATKPGRALVWAYLEEAGIYRTAFNASNAVTAHNCGKQDVGRFILAHVMRVAPERFIDMQKEGGEAA